MSSIATVLSYVWSTIYIFTGTWYFLPRIEWFLNWLWSFWSDPEAERIQKSLDNARTYDEWLQAAQALDEHFPGNMEWKHDAKSNLYDWVQIQGRVSDIQTALLDEDISKAHRLLEFGMVRGLGTITDHRLYNRVYSGTKILIETYINVMLNLIDAFFGGVWKGSVPTEQTKLDNAERFRKAFGKTALVLQGGSIFGLYHIGVMKALYERELLPRVILGTGTGAIMAALVGVHMDEELPDFLDSRGINLDAFSGRGRDLKPAWYEVVLIFFKRLKRFYQSGYVLDRDALERCVEDNVGDTTFREAHDRTGRIISIAIECDSPGTPNCLNYITTPHVLIRSAAMASNEGDPDIAPAMILQKNSRGEIENWSLNDEHPAYKKFRRKHYRRPPVNYDPKTPLRRMTELENINNFIISQARPYLIPFLTTSLHRSKSPRTARAGFWSITAARNALIRGTGKQLAHWANQFDSIWGLPRRIRRFLVDEKVPFRSLTLVPEVQLKEFTRLLRNPNSEEIDHWIALGEKSVWPCVTALEVRCNIEFDLENRYVLERRRPLHVIYRQEEQMSALGGAGRRRTRVRSTSAESNPRF